MAMATKLHELLVSSKRVQKRLILWDWLFQVRLALILEYHFMSLSSVYIHRLIELEFHNIKPSGFHPNSVFENFKFLNLSTNFSLILA